MRKITNLETGWQFCLSGALPLEDGADFAWQQVTLPHTWNAQDGQDGGNDYYRGKGWYKKQFAAPESKGELWLCFQGVNHICDVWLNGNHILHHEGGFSAFQAELTPYLAAENTLLVCADNSAGTHVYPQAADFTFFGGIYRGVTLEQLEPSHFSMEKAGSRGIFVTPGEGGHLRVDAFAHGTAVAVDFLDADGHTVAAAQAPVQDGCAVVELTIPAAKPWQGRQAPHLYTARLTVDGMDEQNVRFGFRQYRADPVRGFMLNGNAYPLHGVSRHQDRQDKGWAVSRQDHAEDMALICEMGVTALRLAHYQHAQEFYDLCDENGLVVWAEIPFISMFDPEPEAVANTLSQMRELVVQNYNHPSICFWGIANEISVGGESPALEKNLRELNALAKRLDPSRLTTIANMSMTPLDSCHNFLTDVVAYNHYFGWYMGRAEEFGPWLDGYHAANPDRPLALSEYGAEAVMGWHTDTPHVKDYTEEYQAALHHLLLEAFSTRPYLWGTFVWNMFDFAADGRDEGGCKGRNNKGLVTYDRKIKKDAFYLYKAYWTEAPFVYLAGKRYRDRPGATANFQVYGNGDTVTLLVNGKTVETRTGAHVFTFEKVALAPGENTVTVRSGACEDTAVFCRVETPNPAYTCAETEEECDGNVENWFTSLLPENRVLVYPAGRYSLRDPMGVLMANPKTRAFLQELILAPLAKKAEQTAEPGDAGELLHRAAAVPLEAIWPFIGKKLPRHTDLLLNERLNTVEKEEGDANNGIH